MVPTSRVASLACAMALLLAGGSTLAQACAANLVANGDFHNGTTGWEWTTNIDPTAADGQLCAQVTGGTPIFYDIDVNQVNIPLAQGAKYRFSFDASATPGEQFVAKVMVVTPLPPYPNELVEQPAGSSELQHFSYEFTADTSTTDAAVSFQLGGDANTWQFCLTHVSLVKA